MTTIIITVLIVSCIVCARGWLKWYISTLSITCYLVQKGYTPPNKEEMEECTRYTVEHLCSEITGNRT